MSDDLDDIWVECCECGIEVLLCPDEQGYHQSIDVFCDDCLWLIKDSEDDDI